MTTYKDCLASANGENNVCTVIATAVATGTDYHQAHKLWADHGHRRRNRGAYFARYAPTIFRMLGYKMTRVQDPRVKTPKTAAKYLTKGTYCCLVRGHVFTMVDGKIEDWTEGRQNRIKTIYRVEPEGSAEPVEVPTLSDTVRPQPRSPRTQIRLF